MVHHPNSYYTIIGVTLRATIEEIKCAYRRLAHKYHPDINHDSSAESRMKDINRAYEALCTIVKAAANRSNRHPHSPYMQRYNRTRVDIGTTVT